MATHGGSQGLASLSATEVTISGQIAPRLLAWSSTNMRDLPWRRTRDPWAVLVSEVMLQQTQVERVIPKYEAFLDDFPDPGACARHDVAAVIRHWDGLGYNRRAVNLWNAARMIAEKHAGVVPDQLGELLALPGVGPYTAHAILALAFERDVGVIDTNIGRLLARWHGHGLSAPDAQRLADAVVPRGDAWRWTQTLFDFAVARCAKRDPLCADCPLHDACAWRGDGPDPAAKSAGVSQPQSKFVGSLRQVRGQIVRTLRAGPIRLAELDSFATATHDGATVERLVDELVAEGLVERIADGLRLPEREATD